MVRRRSSQPVLVLTSGEPAGIGPDLCVLLSQTNLPARLVVFADKDLLRQRALQLGLKLHIQDYIAEQPPPRRTPVLEVKHFPLTVPCQAGCPHPANSAYVLQMLDDAISGCLEGKFSALVTAPVHKGVINDAGLPFSGHTEYIATRTQTAHVVMMLIGGGMRVALQTTHLPLREVAAAITPEKLEQTLLVVAQDLAKHFKISAPRIAVAGLNPHAGESGYLGREEIEVMTPVLRKLQTQGMRVSGPFPADTLFNRRHLQELDCVLVMYHDQGLPVLKYASFGTGVNVTLGLPIIRTSVDHGTALALAGTGQIERGSLAAAIALAIDLT